MKDRAVSINPRAMAVAFFMALSVVFIFAQTVQGKTFSRETPVVQAVRKAGPAVVNISTVQKVKGRVNPFSRFQGRDDLFGRFFRDFFEFPKGREQTRSSLGSGVIIDGKRGYILTNEHVVARADEITVIMGDEKEFKAEMVGSDPDSDLAVLKIITDEELPALKMGDSSDLMIGETVIAIGNPFGLTHTVTTGVISALNRNVRVENRVYRSFIQIDASINPGNSGGPLLDVNAQLVGINTAIYAQANGIGFAIPINKAKRILESLISYGEVRPVWLGLSLQDLEGRLVEYFKTPNQDGVLVNGVDDDGPAASTGLQRGDVIVKMDRQRVSTVDDFEDMLKTYTQNEKVKLTFHRKGKPRSVTVIAETFPIQKAARIGFDQYGLRVEIKKAGRLSDTGLKINKIKEDSPAAEVGLRAGDILHQINEIKITSTDAYLKAIAKYRLRHSISMVVQRGQNAYRLTLSK